jgi:hypothetical protein
MFPPSDECGIAIENGAAVLMARIVDGAGRSIRRADVAAVAYWIYEIDDRLPHGRVVAGYDGIALDVREVLFNSLQAGGLWTVDVSGYNFRHEFDVPPEEILVTAGARFDIYYEFTPMFGEKTIIRFQLGSLSR